jgi:CBS domain-containing protein
MNDLKEIVEANGNGIYAIDPRATVFDAVVQMCRVHVRSLLVGSVVDPVGIMCERDILERVIRVGLDPKATTVESVMSQPLVSLPEDATPSEALTFLRTQKVHQVPIVSDEAVIGMVSASDLMRWATDSLDDEIRMLNEYCSGKYPG